MSVKMVRVGSMPGKIGEYAIETGTSIKEVLNIAGLGTDNYEVKVDGVKVTDFEGTFVTDYTNMVLVAKQVKGNMDKMVRIGTMPGRIEEYALQTGTSIADVLNSAGFGTAGYEVKVDGVKVEDFNNTYVTEYTNLILLAKQVKGNR